MGIENIVEDWGSVKKRWQAWWNRELYDRVAISIRAPRDNVSLADTPKVDSKTKWTDTDFIIRRTEESIRTTCYLGEAIPWCWNPISSGHALYFGCIPHFSDETMTVKPAPTKAGGYPSLRGWKDSSWWHLARSQVEAFAQASKGRFFVLPFWGNHAGDTLAAVRGFTQFYLDIALDPEWVKSAMKEMSDILIEIHKELFQLAFGMTTRLEGSLNYNGCWSPEKTLSFDCDISCNVSAKTFREMFLPLLIESMHYVDHRIYHLDGPGALHHLDSLLDVSELHAIQWGPGAGREEIMQWVPLIKKIQKKCKAVQVSIKLEEVEPLLHEVCPEGLHIDVVNCATVSEGRKLLERVAKL